MTDKHLDELIVTRLKSSDGMSFCRVNLYEVRDEVQRIAVEENRKAFRVLLGRLQRLKKGGVIEFDKNNGWRAIWVK